MIILTITRTGVYHLIAQFVACSLSMLVGWIFRGVYEKQREDRCD